MITISRYNLFRTKHNKFKYVAHKDADSEGWTPKPVNSTMIFCPMRLDDEMVSRIMDVRIKTGRYVSD